MTLQQLSTVDAFLVVDIPGAQKVDGLVRCARKVLPDSTRALARVRTYAWALLGRPISGASGGVNAEGDQRESALASFAEELAPRVASGELTLEPARGCTASELAGLGPVVEPDPASLVAGLIAAATVLAGGLSGRTVAIEHDGGAGELLRSALVESGARIVADGAEALGASADFLLFGSKPGVVDHTAAETIETRFLVPTGDLAFSPRALAVATQRKISVLPDFLTTAGPLAARIGMDPAAAVADLTEAVMARPQGAVVGACLAAEEFLESWVPEMPFGRPIG